MEGRMSLGALIHAGSDTSAYDMRIILRRDRSTLSRDPLADALAERIES
jgi:hypothetical protein